MINFTIKCVSILAAIWMINCDGEHTKSNQDYEEPVPRLRSHQKSLGSVSSRRTDTSTAEFTAHYRKWYTFYPALSTQETSQRRCAANQGHLLSIMHEKELDRIQKFICTRAISNTSQIYTSGLLSGNTYRWWNLEAASVLSTSAKDTSSPCIAYNFLGPGSVKCDFNLSSICEYIEVTKSITPAIINGECCKSEKSERKFYHMHAEEVEWSTAQRKCKENGMRLATVSSFHENQILNKKIYSTEKFTKREHYWLGGRRVGKHGRYEWQHNRKPLIYANWGLDQPNFWDSTQFCLETMGILGWNDRQCEFKYKYACEDLEPKKAGEIGVDCFTSFYSLFENQYKLVMERLRKLNYLPKNL